MAEVSGLVCQKQFDRFVIQYKKSYGSNAQRQSAQLVFCGNLDLIERWNADTKKSSKLAINEYSDVHRIPNYGYISLKGAETLPQSSGTNYAYNSIDPYNQNATINTYNRINETQIRTVCSDRKNEVGRVNIDPAVLLLADIPPRTDLRKMGTMLKILDQGTCGSCYAVTATLVFATQLMRDLPYYLSQEGYSDIWNLTTLDARLSVQYVLNRTFGINQYCSGGNFEYVASDMAYYKIDTLETASNYPYTAMYDRDDMVYTSVPLRPQSQLPYKVNPVHYFGFFDNKDGCPGTTVMISARNGIFGETEKNVIKSVLARGIAIAGQMHTEGSSTDNNRAFQSYSGGIFQADCRMGYSSNHQISYVGYGTYKGVPVWVLANTWGENWGVKGTFMIQQDQNSMCAENYVSIQMNRYFGYDDDSLVAFRDSKAYRQYSAVESGNVYTEGKYYYDLNSIHIRDGINGLDYEDGSYSTEKKNAFFIIMLSLLVLCGVFVLYYAAVWLCCQPKNLIKPTIYIRFGEEDAARWNWGNAVKIEPHRETA